MTDDISNECVTAALMLGSGASSDATPRESFCGPRYAISSAYGQRCPSHGLPPFRAWLVHHARRPMR